MNGKIIAFFAGFVASSFLLGLLFVFSPLGTLLPASPALHGQVVPVNGPPSASDCGDGDCNAGEACATCPVDCGSCPPNPPPTTSICGDGDCNAGEACATCPVDCGSCPPNPPPTTSICGDGDCNAGEACATCPVDCGSCPPNPPRPDDDYEGKDKDEDEGVVGDEDGDEDEDDDDTDDDDDADRVPPAPPTAATCDPADPSCAALRGSCGNGYCDGAAGENPANCPGDCPRRVGRPEPASVENGSVISGEREVLLEETVRVEPVPLPAPAEAPSDVLRSAVPPLQASLLSRMMNPVREAVGVSIDVVSGAVFGVLNFFGGLFR